MGKKSSTEITLKQDSKGNDVDKAKIPENQTNSSNSSVKKDDTQEVPFICPYCGVGCNLELIIKNGKATKVVAKGRNLELNNKFICIKGISVIELLNNPNRLKRPLIRQNGKLVEVDWETGLREAAKIIAKNQANHPPESFGVLISGKITNEEGFLAQKFARTVLHTNNIDTCARLCHGPSEVGLKRMFGFGAVSTCLNDFKNAEVIFLVGANTKATHPGVWDMIKNREKECFLIIADVFDSQNQAQPNLKLTPKPKSDIYWLNGVARILYENNLYEKDFIESRTIGFENYIKSLWKYDKFLVEEKTGIPWEMLELVANVIAHRKTMFVWGMGLTQHAHGTEAVMSFANLAILTGNLGREGGGVVPLRGQSNIQGVSDMGCSPSNLPGAFDLADPGAILHFQGIWNKSIPEKVGLSATEIIHEIADGKIKCLYVIGENPILSEPQSSFVRWMLQSNELEGLIVQDIFLTETAQMADVVLPAAMTCEKEGLYTNADRRIQYSAKGVEPAGEAKADWEIIQLIANMLGEDWKYTSSQDIWDEVRRIAPMFSGASYDRLKGSVGLRWPIYNMTHPGTLRLYEKTFMFKDGRARFYPIPPPKFLLLPTEDYPIMLITHRLFEHFNTGSMSRQSAMLLRMKSEPYVELSKIDFDKAGLTEEKNQVRITSPFGTLVTKAKVSNGLNIEPGYAVAPIHFFDKANFNQLTSTYPLDAYAKMPSLKSVPVNIKRED